MKLRSMTTLAAILAFAAAPVFITGCEDDDLDDAANEVEDAVEDGADAIKDGAQDLGDNIKDGVDDLEDDVDDSVN